MTWRYRIIKRKVGDDTEYAIVEYYSSGGYAETGLCTYASHEEEPTDEKCLANMRWTLQRMLEATQDPLIEVLPDA